MGMAGESSKGCGEFIDGLLGRRATQICGDSSLRNRQNLRKSGSIFTFPVISPQPQFSSGDSNSIRSGTVNVCLRQLLNGLPGLARFELLISTDAFSLYANNFR
jgi:hypothetical protein